VGKTVPLYCSAAGRAIIAFLETSISEPLIKSMTLKPYTSNTITDKAVFQKVLEETRVGGYATSWGEYDTDIVVVGAPIFNIHDRVIGSCAIAALESRVKDQEKIDRFGTLVKKTSYGISKKLGAHMDTVKRFGRIE
jgi:DNA-binding IclR family transcriptional regulator